MVRKKGGGGGVKDFQRKKVKVGKTVKRSNVTEIKVKARRIDMPTLDIGSLSSLGPRELLSRLLKQLSHHASHTRTHAILYLKDFFSDIQISSSYVTMALPSILEVLFDSSSEVRKSLLILLSVILHSFESEILRSITDIIVTYMCSGLTSLNGEIRSDTLLALSMFTSQHAELLQNHHYSSKLMTHLLSLLSESSGLITRTIDKLSSNSNNNNNSNNNRSGGSGSNNGGGNGRNKAEILLRILNVILQLLINNDNNSMKRSSNVSNSSSSSNSMQMHCPGQIVVASLPRTSLCVCDSHKGLLSTHDLRLQTINIVKDLCKYMNKLWTTACVQEGIDDTDVNSNFLPLLLQVVRITNEAIIRFGNGNNSKSGVDFKPTARQSMDEEIIEAFTSLLLNIFKPFITNATLTTTTATTTVTTTSIGSGYTIQKVDTLSLLPSITNAVVKTSNSTSDCTLSPTSLTSEQHKAFEEMRLLNIMICELAFVMDMPLVKALDSNLQYMSLDDSDIDSDAGTSSDGPLIATNHSKKDGNDSNDSDIDGIRRLAGEFLLSELESLIKSDTNRVKNGANLVRLCRSLEHILSCCHSSQESQIQLRALACLQMLLPDNNFNISNSNMTLVVDDVNVDLLRQCLICIEILIQQNLSTESYTITRNGTEEEDDSCNYNDILIVHMQSIMTKIALCLVSSLKLCHFATIKSATSTKNTVLTNDRSIIDIMYTIGEPLFCCLHSFFRSRLCLSLPTTHTIVKELKLWLSPSSIPTSSSSLSSISSSSLLMFTIMHASTDWIKLRMVDLWCYYEESHPGRWSSESILKCWAEDPIDSSSDGINEDGGKRILRYTLENMSSFATIGSMDVDTNVDIDVESFHLANQVEASVNSLALIIHKQELKVSTSMFLSKDYFITEVARFLVQLINPNNLVVVVKLVATCIKAHLATTKLSLLQCYSWIKIVGVLLLQYHIKWDSVECKSLLTQVIYHLFEVYSKNEQEMDREMKEIQSHGHEIKNSSIASQLSRFMATTVRDITGLDSDFPVCAIIMSIIEEKENNMNDVTVVMRLLRYLTQREEFITTKHVILRDEIEPESSSARLLKRLEVHH